MYIHGTCRPPPTWLVAARAATSTSSCTLGLARGFFEGTPTPSSAWKITNRSLYAVIKFMYSFTCPAQTSAFRFFSFTLTDDVTELWLAGGGWVSGMLRTRSETGGARTCTGAVAGVFLFLVFVEVDELCFDVVHVVTVGLVAAA